MRAICMFVCALGTALPAAIATVTAAAAQPAAPRARITETLRLDATREEFTYIGRMAVGPHGEMAIPQVTDATLRIYDSTGKRVATVGRRGSGPGEFRFLSGIGWFADTIWAYDDELKRSTFITPSGAVIRTTALASSLSQYASDGAPGQLRFFAPAVAARGGSLLGTAHYVVASRPGERPADSQRAVRVLPNGSLRALANVELIPADKYLVVSGWRKSGSCCTEPPKGRSHSF